ncbi:MAG: hypothetical protein KA182_03190, partial [Propionivibrio sp.]|nr:hypothetical protein [Propionivibrio sp.]
MPGVAAVEMNLLGVCTASLSTFFAADFLGADFLTPLSATGAPSIVFCFATELSAATGLVSFATGLARLFFGAVDLSTSAGVALGVAFFFSTTAAIDFDTACLTACFDTAGFFALVAIQPSIVDLKEYCSRTLPRRKPAGVRLPARYAADINL